MARIILYLNDQFLRDVPLSHDTITVGRKPDNDIQLDNHAVSGYHAQIVTLLNDSFVEDLNSTNGTQVNDHPIRKRALKEGDRIGIYNYRLVYTRQKGSVRPISPAQADKTMIIRMDAVGLPKDTADANLERVVQAISREAPGRDMPPPNSAPVPGTPTTAGNVTKKAEDTPVRTARLRILSGPNAGRSLELVKTLTTLGRPGVQVAAISRRTQGYMIIHVDGGASGQSPKVNGQPIGQVSRALRDGDIIDIAGVRMEFGGS